MAPGAVQGGEAIHLHQIYHQIEEGPQTGIFQGEVFRLMAPLTQAPQVALPEGEEEGTMAPAGGDLDIVPPRETETEQSQIKMMIGQ